MKCHSNCRQNGFTLAEVLITLGVIGVVAAFTLPSVISNYKEREYVEKLNKAYSTISQAFTAAIADYGTVDMWCETPLSSSAECSKKISETVQKYLKVQRVCTSSDGKCFSKKYDGANFGMADYRGLLLSDGISFSLSSAPGDNILNNWCKTTVSDFSTASFYNNCGYMYIDITGPNLPNVKGKDLFLFKIYKDGIRPAGTTADFSWSESFKEQCLAERPSHSARAYCAGWVIINKNMDYWHCKDLDWYEKTSCKKKVN